MTWFKSRPADLPLRWVIATVVSVACSGALADQPSGGARRTGGAEGKVSSAAKTAPDRLLCVHGVEAGQGLQVRTGAGADKPVIGSVPADQCGISLVGKCDGDWCEMALGDLRGWVDTRFVGVYEIPDLGKAQRSKTAAASSPPRADRRTPAVTAPAATKAVASAAGHHDGRIRRPSRRHRAAGDQDSSRLASAHYSRLYFGRCVSRVAWWDTLRIRTGPGTGHDEIDGIPSGACRVEPAGACRGAWCRIAWRGRVGWVNTYYLE